MAALGMSIQCARLYLAFRRLEHRFIEGDQFNARDCQFARLLRDRGGTDELGCSDPSDTGRVAC